jgi:hypothetical protein
MDERMFARAPDENQSAMAAVALASDLLGALA